MLGPLTIVRNGAALELPASRKVRALFAYLALAPHAVGRSRLCDLLWDVPNDPRGELRWCLSKLRSVLDEPGRQRIETSGDTVALDLDDCFVDAIDIASAAEQRHRDARSAAAAGPVPTLRRRLPGRAGDRPQPAFQQLADRPKAPLQLLPRRRCWSIWSSKPPGGVRRGVRASGEVGRARPVRRARAPGSADDAGASAARFGECEEHLAAAARLFESEELDFSPFARHGARSERRAASTRSAQRRCRRARALQSIGSADDRRRCVPPRLACRHAVCRRSRQRRRSRRAGRRPHPRHHHPPGQAQEFLRHRARFGFCARRAQYRPGRRRPAAERRLRRQRQPCVSRRAASSSAVELVEVRTARIVWAEVFDHKLDDTFWSSTRSATASSRRSRPRSRWSSATARSSKRRTR